jgi:hypothetical protein
MCTLDRLVVAALPQLMIGSLLCPPAARTEDAAPPIRSVTKVRWWWWWHLRLPQVDDLLLNVVRRLGAGARTMAGGGSRRRGRAERLCLVRVSSLLAVRMWLAFGAEAAAGRPQAARGDHLQTGSASVSTRTSETAKVADHRGEVDAVLGPTSKVPAARRGPHLLVDRPRDGMLHDFVAVVLVQVVLGAIKVLPEARLYRIPFQI